MDKWTNGTEMYYILYLDIYFKEELIINLINIPTFKNFVPYATYVLSICPLWKVKRNRKIDKKPYK